jgi:NAD+ diphosphatase
MDRIEILRASELTFAGALDRATHLREGEEPVRLRASAGAGVVLVGEGQSVLLEDMHRLARLPVPPDGELVFLGLDPAGRAVFASDGAEADVPRHGRGFTPLRQAAADLDHDEAALGAYAVALVGWHRTHRHCGRCGTLTRVEQAGHSRRCPACGLHTFPRTDPAVTMLVEAGERCLLTRRRHAATATTWSALAGFVEPGETPEAAVAREAREEVGIEVVAVEYVTSQPWPFPQALMIGYRAFTDAEPGGAAVHEPRELVEARWWSRPELQAALDRREIGLPPPISIGYKLITDWLRRAD